MNKIFTLFLLFFTLVVAAQQNANRVKFTYDSAGNQISRIVCIGCGAKNATQVYKDSTAIIEEDLIKDLEYEQISYYPNPVLEELYIKWKNINGSYVSNIELYTMSGQLVKTSKNLRNAENTSISFQGLPEGFYNLILNYDNGEKKTLRIVKNKN